MWLSSTGFKKHDEALNSNLQEKGKEVGGKGRERQKVKNLTINFLFFKVIVLFVYVTTHVSANAGTEPLEDRATG